MYKMALQILIVIIEDTPVHTRHHQKDCESRQNPNFGVHTSTYLLLTESSAFCTPPVPLFK